MDPKPDSVSRAEYLPTMIHNQPCGNCWAVGAATILTAYFNKLEGVKNSDRLISPQSIMDCVNKNERADMISNGCEGGYIGEVADFINSKKFRVRFGRHFHLIKDYPYNTNAVKYFALKKSAGAAPVSYFHEKCDSTIKQNLGESSIPWPDSLMATFTKFEDNRQMYKKFVEWGPMAVRVRVGHDKSVHRFRYLFSNLFAKAGHIHTQKDCGITNETNQINHVVSLFGYDRDGDYWITRNSWGEGDIQFDRRFTAKDKDDACGIRQGVLYFYHLTMQPLKPTKKINRDKLTI